MQAVAARTMFRSLLLFGVAASLGIWSTQTLRAQATRNEPVAGKTQPVTEPIPVSASWEFEEELAQIREDLRSQELWIKAKEAQLKAADCTAETERKVLNEGERLNKKGIVSNLRQKAAVMMSLEADSGQAMARAELADLQTRYNRTKRRLERLEKMGPSALSSSGDRSLEQTEILTRLRLAEQAVTSLQEQLKTAQSHIRVLERQGRFGDPQP